MKLSFEQLTELDEVTTDIQSNDWTSASKRLVQLSAETLEALFLHARERRECDAVYAVLEGMVAQVLCERGQMRAHVIYAFKIEGTT